MHSSLTQAGGNGVHTRCADFSTADSETDSSHQMQASTHHIKCRHRSPRYPREHDQDHDPAHTIAMRTGCLGVSGRGQGTGGMGGGSHTHTCSGVSMAASYTRADKIAWRYSALPHLLQPARVALLQRFCMQAVYVSRASLAVADTCLTYTPPLAKECAMIRCGRRAAAAESNLRFAVWPLLS